MVEVGVETSLREMSPAVLVLHLCLVALAFGSALLGGSSLAAVFDFMLMFLVVGQSLRLGLIQSVAVRLSSDSMRVNLLIDSLLSIMMTSCFAIVFASLMLLRWMLPALVFVMLVLDAHGLQHYAKISHNRRSISLSETGFQLVRPNLRFILSFLFGVLMAVWLTRYLQWPEAAGADLFVHSGVTRLIAAEGGSFSLFGTYPYVFHCIAAAIVLSSGLDPFPLFGYGIFLVYPIGTVVMHVFFEEFMAGKWKPLLTLFATSFVAEGGALLGLRYTYPSTYVFVSTLLVLSAIRMAPQSRSLLVTVAGAVLCLIVIYPAALLTTLPLTAYMWCNRSPNSTIKHRLANLIIVSGILGGTLVIVVYYALLPLFGIAPLVFQLPFGFLDVTASLSLDVAIFTNAYSLLQILLLACGLASLAWSVCRRNSSHLEEIGDDRFVLLSAMFYLVVFFLPTSYGYRTELYIRPLLSICIVEGAVLVAGTVLTAAKMIHVSTGKVNASRSETAFVLAVLLIVGLSAVPTVARMDIGMMNEPLNISADEIHAFDWLGRHVPGWRICLD